jgi:hypothetical protein
MVELFTPLDLPGHPNLVRDPAPTVTSLEAPHAGTRSANPLSQEGPNPVGGFAGQMARAPTLKHDGPNAKASGSFRIAPVLEAKHYRIER